MSKFIEIFFFKLVTILSIIFTSCILAYFFYLNILFIDYVTIQIDDKILSIIVLLFIYALVWSFGFTIFEFCKKKKKELI
jgi:hypothetical protein